jgi:hypothetical protein
MQDIKFSCTECGAENSVKKSISAGLRADLFAEFQKEFEDSHSEQFQAQLLRAKELDAQEAVLKKRTEEVDSEIEQRLMAQRADDQKDIDARAKAMAERQLNHACKERDHEIEYLQRQVEKLTTDGLELARLQRERNLTEHAHALEKENLRTELEAKFLRDQDSIRRAKDEERKEALQEQAIKHEQTLKTLQKGVGILEQGSQQIQGEILENKIEDFLENRYSLDEVKPVPKGVKGADCLLIVNGKTNSSHGSILVEAKNTKQWSKEWPDKLRRDMQAAKADFAIIVSKALPPECDDFCVDDGIQICSPDAAPIVFEMARQMVSQRYQERLKSNSRGSKKDRLFDFIHSPEFYMQVQIGVGAFKKLKAVTESERDFMNRSWAKSDRLIEQITGDIMSTLGDFEAILQSKAVIDFRPDIEHTELH